VVDNLKLGQWSKGVSSENIFEVLKKLGILHVSKKPVNTLSYGQQQRLSVARALTSKAPLILADEPTSSLDEENKINVLKLFQEHQSETKCSMIISTHDSNIDSIAHQIVNLK
jgi:ABC-type lipoprotein export system ATPase subunit